MLGCDLPLECLEAIEYCCCRFQSRGLFLQPPTVGLTQGQWQISIPSEMWDFVNRNAGSQMDDVQLTFPRREGVFRQRQDVQDAYASYIASHWQQYESGRPVRIAACIMEPVLQVIQHLSEQLRPCICVLGSCLFFVQQMLAIQHACARTVNVTNVVIPSCHRVVSLDTISWCHCCPGSWGLS